MKASPKCEGKERVCVCVGEQEVEETIIPEC